MDGGIDDALALILAMRIDALDVLGITSVSGNVPVGQATVNALRVVELLNKENVWVAIGRARPLARNPIRATRFHGKDGLGDSHLPLPKLRAYRENALDKLCEELDSSRKRELSIIATGPLTNIASLIRKRPDAARKVKELSIMGGAYGLTPYGIGNETPSAEFNVYSDPEAAKIVFGSRIPIKAAGLDVTMIPSAQLSMGDFSKIKRGRSRVAWFASKILAKSMRERRFALHDPMAVAALAIPTLFKFEKLGVVVETRGEYTTGMTVADRRLGQDVGRERIAICEDVDGERFRRVVVLAITSGADSRS